MNYFNIKYTSNRSTYIFNDMTHDEIIKYLSEFCQHESCSFWAFSDLMKFINGVIADEDTPAEEAYEWTELKDQLLSSKDDYFFFPGWLEPDAEYVPLFPDSDKWIEGFSIRVGSDLLEFENSFTDSFVADYLYYLAKKIAPHEQIDALIEFALKTQTYRHFGAKLYFQKKDKSYQLCDNLDFEFAQFLKSL